MKKISIDMDGVMADVYSQFTKMYTAETGLVKTVAELEGKPEGEVFEHALEYVASPGFFRHAPLMEGCLDVVRRLNDQYKIFIVSAAMEFPTSLVEKHAWLNENFPFIGWQQMVFCGSKEIIRADIMIDDHFKNLNFFTGETILYTQPHNKLADAGKHTRINNWKEIEMLLLP
jgi:5'-nucleotidase